MDKEQLIESLMTGYLSRKPIIVWTECSGGAEKMWSDANGVKIPAAYLPLFFDEQTMETVEYSEEDEYHYTRLVGRWTVDEQRIEKMIFGFPNREVLDKYIEDKNTTLEKLCKAYGIKADDLLNEGFYYRDAPEYLWPQMRLIRHYSDELNRGRMELTQKEIDAIQKALEEIYGYFADKWEIVTQTDGLWALLFHFVAKFNRCIVMKVYEIGDTFEPEKEKFWTANLTPGAMQY